MEEKTKKYILLLLDIVLNIAIIIVMVLVIQKWIIAPFYVSGPSMCNTMNYIDDECQSGVAQKIIINEALYLFNDPKRGEIVVFKSPKEDKYLIKRIIAVPGDTIRMENGELYLKTAEQEEFYKLEEPYLNEENKGNTLKRFPSLEEFYLTEGNYFVLGDNRAHSTDSRSCFESSTFNSQCPRNPEQAFLPRENILGKAWVTWWPPSQIGFIEH
jgi:signal peptidase I